MAYGVRVYYKKIASGASAGTSNDLSDTIPSGTVAASGTVVAPDSGIACQIGLYGGTIQDLFGPSLDKSVVLTFSNYGEYSFSYAEYLSLTRKQLISVVGSYSLTGTVTAEFAVGSCTSNDECEEGEKCVDGECVPCEEQQATHFQIRFEYSELATDSGGSQSMYHLSSIIPISGSEELVIQGTEINQAKYYPRIRFCDSAGNIKPYTGTLSFYGFTTPDKAWTLYPSNGNLTEASTFIGSESQTDAVSNNPWFMPRVLINHIDDSAVIYETDCSSVTPEEPPDIEPVYPEEPVEPDEPTEPEEPTEPTEPTKPTEPDAPETGCDCEIFIGEQIARAANILYDGIILLKREMSVGFREIVVEMYEARKMNYQLSMFLQNQQYQVMQAQHERLFEIRQILESIRDDIQKGLIKGADGLIDIVKTGLVDGDDGLIDIVKTGLVDGYDGLIDIVKTGLVDGDDGLIDIVKTGLVDGDDGLIDIVKTGLVDGDDGLIDIVKTGLVDGDDGLIDIVKTGLQEGEQGLVDFVKEFVEQYEPVTIENEYRTQSHRLIDNLDEVVNKL